jgi:hypothetical protein
MSVSTYVTNFYVYVFGSSVNLLSRYKLIPKVESHDLNGYQLVEDDSQNLRLINGRFPTLSSHFFSNYMNIFHKTEVQTVILRW